MTNLQEIIPGDASSKTLMSRITALETAQRKIGKVNTPITANRSFPKPTKMLWDRGSFGLRADFFADGNANMELIARRLASNGNIQSLAALLRNERLIESIVQAIFPGKNMKVKVRTGQTIYYHLRDQMARIIASKLGDTAEGGAFGVIDALTEVIIYILSPFGLVVPTTGRFDLDRRYRPIPTYDALMVEVRAQSLQRIFENAKMHEDAGKVKELTPQVLSAILAPILPRLGQQLGQVEDNTVAIADAFQIIRAYVFKHEGWDRIVPRAMQNGHADLDALCTNMTLIQMALSAPSVGALTLPEWMATTSLSSLKSILTESTRYKEISLVEFNSTFAISPITTLDGMITSVIVSRNLQGEIRPQVQQFMPIDESETLFALTEVKQAEMILADALASTGSMWTTSTSHDMAVQFASTYADYAKEATVHRIACTEEDLTYLAVHHCTDLIVGVEDDKIGMSPVMLFGMVTDNKRFLSKNKKQIWSRAEISDPAEVLLLISPQAATSAAQIQVQTIQDEARSRYFRAHDLKEARALGGIFTAIDRTFIYAPSVKDSKNVPIKVQVEFSLPELIGIRSFADAYITVAEANRAIAQSQLRTVSLHLMRLKKLLEEQNLTRQESVGMKFRFAHMIAIQLQPLTKSSYVTALVSSLYYKLLNAKGFPKTLSAAEARKGLTHKINTMTARYFLALILVELMGMITREDRQAVMNLLTDTDYFVFGAEQSNPNEDLFV